jgi:sarcosine oxidase subunit beta
MKVVKSDVIIIGGGIIGCAIGYEMAKRNRSVIVFEKGTVGGEASGRNPGGVRQSNRNPAELPLAIESIKIWSNLKKELEYDVEYQQIGHIRLLISKQEYNIALENVEWAKKFGLDMCILTPEETRNRIPFLSKDVSLLGATYCQSDGVANPLLVTRAFAKAACKLGVQIKENEELEKLIIDSGRIVSAITNHAQFRAEVFINAAGAGARNICNQIGLDFPITIKRNHLLVTEPLPHFVNEFISGDFGYMRQALTGGILLGIYGFPSDHYNNSTLFQAFLEAAKRHLQFFPFLKKVNIIRSWAGTTNWTPDEIPIIDRSPTFDNFFLASGFSGHGYCLGPIIGRLMTEWILDGKTSLDLSSFKWMRFEDIYKKIA